MAASGWLAMGKAMVEDPPAGLFAAGAAGGGAPSADDGAAGGGAVMAGAATWADDGASLADATVVGDGGGTVFDLCDVRLGCARGALFLPIGPTVSRTAATAPTTPAPTADRKSVV